MSYSLPGFPKKEIESEMEYSLPYPIIHKPLDTSPLQIIINKPIDGMFIPNE